MRSIVASILGLFLLAGTAFCGGGEQCPHLKSGDRASVLVDAAKALEASNPELAAKVKAIADDCCKLGLHDAESKEASESEQPAAASSEQPAAAASEHPSSEQPA